MARARRGGAGRGAARGGSESEEGRRGARRRGEARRSDQLDPWDVVCFPAGPAGAHAVRNDTEDPARVLMYSTRSSPAVAVYPDSDKIGVWVGHADDDLLLSRSAAVTYYHGEA